MGRVQSWVLPCHKIGKYQSCSFLFRQIGFKTRPTHPSGVRIGVVRALISGVEGPQAPEKNEHLGPELCP